MDACSDVEKIFAVLEILEDTIRDTLEVSSAHQIRAGALIRSST